MKKKYIRPTLDVVASQLNEHLMDYSFGWADAKEQNVEDVKEKKPLEDLEFRNIWDEEEEE